MSDDQVLEGGLEVAKEFIPARTRRAVYAAASILGYLLAAAVVGFVTAGADVPVALAVALAVLGALVGPIGQLAASHTPLPLPEA
jgi:hypothetical protein